ncbi:MAG TPA: hypothetical protein VFH69_09065 [Gemmatimonadota bacterium]|nr:hypothetical protein [Gemmatimonadota bacterium]
MNAVRGARPWILLGAIVLAEAAPGCGDLLQEPDTGIATLVDLVRVSGNGQSGEPGTTLPQPIRVRLVVEDATSTEGLWVEWVVVEGGGRVTPRQTFTDEEGIAETTWTLGPGPGRQRIQARFADEFESFDAQTVD